MCDDTPIRQPCGNTRQHCVPSSRLGFAHRLRDAHLGIPHSERKETTLSEPFETMDGPELAPAPAATEGDMQTGGDMESSARWKVNQEARVVLEQVFVKEPLPSKETINRLASELNVTARRVQVWFQNRRQRCARKWVNKRTWSGRGARGLSPLLPHPQVGHGGVGMTDVDAGDGPFDDPLSPSAGFRDGGPSSLSFAAPVGPTSPGSGAPCQMLLEAASPHRIMWASLGWLELSGYMLTQVLGNTLSLFQGTNTDTVSLDRLLQAAALRGQEGKCTVVHYTKAGAPFQHVLKVERLQDTSLGESQFLLVSSALITPAIQSASATDFIAAALTQTPDLAVRAGAASGLRAGSGWPGPLAGEAGETTPSYHPPAARPDAPLTSSGVALGACPGPGLPPHSGSGGVEAMHAGPRAGEELSKAFQHASYSPAAVGGGQFPVPSGLQQ
mmetsp:Transcript_15734/g.42255  ORF Transcript_15734/g.42255 Transcript_15734/m.42255 type:complete len:444 (-) Transcript_15734:1567-2898(-)